jgi:ABC-type sugar transport system substrate-binding protein
MGAQLDVEVAQGNDTIQVQQADTMLTKGVDVLIIVPAQEV